MLRSVRKRSIRLVSLFLFLCFVSFRTSFGQQPAAQQQPAPSQTPPRPLTVETIWGDPNLSGHLTRGIAWTPDSKQFSYFNDVPSGRTREGRSELWITEVASGKSRVLVPAEKLESLLAAPEKATQATGLGRHAPAQYQWAPSGTALLFQGANALVWLDLKTQTPRNMVLGKRELWR